MIRNLILAAALIACVCSRGYAQTPTPTPTRLTSAVMVNPTTNVLVAPTAAAFITANPTLGLPSQTGNSGKYLTTNGTAASWATISGSGTVTSVALTLPGIFSVTGSPVTTSGTLAAALATQTANTIFAGPASGAAAAPTFRALVADDIPTLTLAKISDAGNMAGETASGLSFDLIPEDDFATNLGSTLKKWASVWTYQMNGVNVNFGAGGTVLFSGGALGTPSSATLTNATGLPVAGGGTGVASLTAYAPIFGGTTATGAVQSGTVGTAGQVLTSNGAGALPTFQTAAAGVSGANPTASVGLSAVNGSATTYLRSDGAPALSQSIAPTWTGIHTFTPAARASGVADYFEINTPADTGITASTESIGLNLTTGTRTWATTGTVALQRERFFAGPTYASASASQTFTEVFNLYLTPPIAGTNAIFTRRHTLGIVDSTSASSSITGGLVVATTLGTSATSVGIGGGNVNAGGTVAGAIVTAGTILDTVGSWFYINSNAATIDLSGTGRIGWAPAGNPAVTKDAGLHRSAVGVLAVHDGTSTLTNYRDLRLSHILTGGTAPTIAAGAGAGTTPTVSIVSGSQDMAGQVSVTTGTTPTVSAVVVTITRNRAMPTGSWPVISPANAAAAALTGTAQVFAANASTTTWTITVGSGGLPASSGPYLWNFHDIGY